MTRRDTKAAASVAALGSAVHVLDLIAGLAVIAPPLSPKKKKKVLKADFPPGTETLVHPHLPASPVTLQIFAKWAALRHVCRRAGASKLNCHSGERRVMTKLPVLARLETLGLLVGFRLRQVGEKKFKKS